MNPVRPDPRPASALLAVVTGGLGLFFWSHSHALGAVLFLASALLLVRFGRGAAAECQLDTVGQRTCAHVLRVEEHDSNEQHMPPVIFHIVFQYADAAGVEHQNFIADYDKELAEKCRQSGAVVNIAYHPDYPDIFRWLN